MQMDDNFPFAVTDEARRWCQRIVEALVTFYGKTDPEAIRLVQAFYVRYEDIESNSMLYHETPYYEAMCIAHHPRLGDGRVFWWKEPGLWPPPEGWVFD